MSNDSQKFVHSTNLNTKIWNTAALIDILLNENKSSDWMQYNWSLSWTAACDSIQKTTHRHQTPWFAFKHPKWIAGIITNCTEETEKEKETTIFCKTN